jgi:hypothetical protein
LAEMEPSVARRVAAGSIGIVLSVYLLLLLARMDGRSKAVLFQWETVSLPVTSLTCRFHSSIRIYISGCACFVQKCFILRAHALSMG